MLHFRSKPLPEIAEQYLSELSTVRRKNTLNLYRAAIHHFYRFMIQSKLELGNLELCHMTDFDEDLARHNLKLVTRRNSFRLLRTYIKWLEDEGQISDGFSKKLFPYYNAGCVKGKQAQLPELALRFIEVLCAVNKPNTVQGYKSMLGAFYKIHWKTNKRPYDIDRTDSENYMLYLKERGMGSNERNARLVQFRRYLDWLFEHQKLKIEPDRLVSSHDIPRREERLPRPFPVNVDLEIQKRLTSSTDIDFLGVLLMRRCGLRVGELRNLTLDCVEEDLNGHWFLKVPLGKLNNERIIPIDPTTLEVVEKIKRHHSSRPEPGTNCKYLISNPSGKRRSRNQFAVVLLEVTKGLAIPGKVTLHRLRHSFATSLLSAGLSITTLKDLLGHRDIRMTLVYAAVTQETLRSEFFTALSKIQSRYEVASYPLKPPDLNGGINQSFYDAIRYIKKFTDENGNHDPQKLTRLLYRLNSLRHEFSILLKADLQ